MPPTDETAAVLIVLPEVDAVVAVPEFAQEPLLELVESPRFSPVMSVRPSVMPSPEISVLMPSVGPIFTLIGRTYRGSLLSMTHTLPRSRVPRRFIG